MSMKTATDTIENRSRDLPTAPPRYPGWQVLTKIPEEIAAVVIRVFQAFPKRTLRVSN
jgi:hypothetical protein